VLGRSDIVGKPMALLLLHRDATVTDLPLADARIWRPPCRQADILVAAVGGPAS
jgi:methylenetetrahydrofolate dehydrogenase (NADP+)/methenyltetrahydrofolate cyclohydrolase